MPPTEEWHPTVQIVVATHRADRPVSRAASSVLTFPDAGVVVVAHGLGADELDLPSDPRVKVVEVERGVGFPGVPFNAGIRAATAPWVGIVGSDDWFEEGAIEAMLRRAEADDADGIIAPRRRDYMDSNIVLPLTLRRSGLRASRDGLFHRTAPLGLFRREILQRPEYAFDETTHSGEDVPVSARLWTQGHKISYYPSDPAYVGGSDAKERTSTVSRPLPEHVPIWLDMWDTRLVRSLSLREAEDLAERNFQVNVITLLQQRPSSEDWPPGDFEWLCSVVAKMAEVAPGFSRGFTRTWQRVYRGLLEGDLSSTLEALSAASYIDNRAPAQPIEVFHRNAWWRKQVREKAAKAKSRREARVRNQGTNAVNR